MASEPVVGGPPSTAIGVLGRRLREERLSSGMTLREMARQLGVSPSFVSQFENGKSQPSVATLYSISQLLGVSVDALFAPETAKPKPSRTDVEPTVGRPPKGRRPKSNAADGEVVNRSDLGSPAEAWERPGEPFRFSLTTRSDRPRLVMDTGVIWEQLARSGDGSSDFMEIIYPPGSSSTNDERMMRHAGFEYGYLLEGELQVTFGFETYMMRAGDALCLDSSRPHLFKNLGRVTARGVWCVHHAHDSD